MYSQSDAEAIYSMLLQFSKAIDSFYQGESKQNLINYQQFLKDVKDRNMPADGLIKVLSVQIRQLSKLYKDHADDIDNDRIIDILNNEDFNLYVNEGSQAYLPISDASIEACAADDVNSIHNIEGYMYSILNVCFPECASISQICKKYTKNKPSESSEVVDSIVSGIMGKIAIKDPEVQAKVQQLGNAFMNSLKKVADVSIDELKKDGVNINDTNGNVSVTKIIPTLTKLMNNQNVVTTIQSAIKDMGGEQKITSMVTGIIGK
jgi:hypothetical protein